MGRAMTAAGLGDGLCKPCRILSARAFRYGRAVVTRLRLVRHSRSVHLMITHHDQSPVQQAELVEAVAEDHGKV